MSHSRHRLPGGALLLALALACSDSTEPPVAPTQPVEATLAFTMDSSIYLISTEEGATPSRLISGFIYPSWSPDGRTLAMVATSPPMAKGFPPTQALYISDADGGNPRALTEAGDLIGRILWSPDGSTLLFPRFHDIMPRFAHIARVAAAGGPEDTPFGNFGDAVPFDGLPSWSGDGSRVALDHGGSIYVANADGSDRTLVSAGAYPQWSPTSDDIAYWEEDGHIHLIRPDGSGERGLGVEGVPRAWSPDGSRLAFIAFSSDTVPKAETWIALADGSNPVRIGPAGADVAGLAWSADSKRISYMARVPGDPVPDRWTIYLSSPDGSGTRVLVPASQILCCISSWRPSNPVAIAIHAGQ